MATLTLDADLAALAEVRAKVKAARDAFDALAGRRPGGARRARAGHGPGRDGRRRGAGPPGRRRDRLRGLRAQDPEEPVQHDVRRPAHAAAAGRRRPVGRRGEPDDGRRHADGRHRRDHPPDQPDLHGAVQGLAAVKSGNAVVMSPHPRAVRCCVRAAEIMAEAAEKAGAPAGLVSCLEQPTMAATNELMRHPDVSLILATGSGDMVRACYSVGEAHHRRGRRERAGVRAPQSVADIAEAATMVNESKSFDNGTACVAEQAVVIDGPVWRRHHRRVAGQWHVPARPVPARRPRRRHLRRAGRPAPRPRGPVGRPPRRAGRHPRPGGDEDPRRPPRRRGPPRAAVGRDPRARARSLPGAGRTRRAGGAAGRSSPSAGRATPWDSTPRTRA